MRKFLLSLLLAALCVLPARAQVAPIKETLVSVNLVCLTKDCENFEHVKPGQSFKVYVRVPHRTADRAFWLMTAVSQAATLADDFNTVYALQRPGTREANPLLQSRPALFGVTEGLFVVNELFMWRAKREDDAMKAADIPGHKYMKWWVVPMFNIAPHALGVGVTIAFTGR